MKIWKDEEVKALFGQVESCKKNGSPLRSAFAAHAQSFKRKPNSVRNYYYHEVDNLAQDEARRARLGVELSLHEKVHFESFAKEQEEELFEKIEKLVQEGCSVRLACQKLSNGNLALMTRLQNKYQNMCRKIKQDNNIIHFQPKQKLLTDNDINSLFLGLVKLIKKNATEEAMEKSQVSNQLLKKAFADLGRKDKELSSLKAEFERLKKENEVLRLMHTQNKNDALKNHLISKRNKLEQPNSKRV